MTSAADASDSPSAPAGAARWLLAVCIALTLAGGFFKLEWQRAHPPADWILPKHLYDGYVAIDDYAARAAVLRDLVAGTISREEFLDRSFTEPFHPAAFSVPALVAALSVSGLSIPHAFALLSAAALVGATLLTVRAARDLGYGREAAAVAGILLVAHLTAQRTAAQLHMDPFCLLVTAIVVARGCRHDWLRVDAPIDRPTFVATALALTIKTSLLPVLLVPSMVVLLAGRGSLRERATTALVRAGAYVGGAFSVAILVVLAVGSTGVLFGDFVHLSQQFALNSRHVTRFAIEMVLLLQVFPLVLLLRPHGADSRWPPQQRALAVALVLILGATWGFKLPPIPRLYLPAVVLLALLAAPRLERWLGPRRGLWLVAAWAATNYAVATYGLLRTPAH